MTWEDVVAMVAVVMAWAMKEARVGTVGVATAEEAVVGGEKEREVGAKAVAARVAAATKTVSRVEVARTGVAAMAAAKEVATVAAAMEVVAMVVMMEGRRVGSWAVT